MFLFLFVAMIFTANAAEEVDVKLLKIFSNKKEFVLKKSDYLSKDKEVFFRAGEMTIPKKGKIKVCKENSCLGEIEAGIFELNPSEIKSYKVTTVKVSAGEKSLYIGYGSPLGAALRAGVRTNDYGLLLGRVDSKAGSAEVKANSLSLIVLKEIYKVSNWKFNLGGELGWAFSLLKFKNDTNKESIKENVYMAAAFVDGQYAFESFSVGLNLGISKSGFKNKYQLKSGEFSNPYSQMLMFVELGVHIPF